MVKWKIRTGRDYGDIVIKAGEIDMLELGIKSLRFEIPEGDNEPVINISFWPESIDFEGDESGDYLLDMLHERANFLDEKIEALKEKTERYDNG